MSTGSASLSASNVTYCRRQVLVCLDLSPLSEVCIPYAVSLAQAFGGAVTLAHIMPCHGEQPGMPTSDVLAWAFARQEAQLYLERIQTNISASLGVPVDLRVEQGRPATRIVDLAREIHADVTILASRGEGAGAPCNLGTTAQQVISLARSSLFFVHASSIPPRGFTPKRILVPLDGSLRAESVLPAVARLAITYGAEVLLVHVVREPLPTALLCDPQDLDIAKSLASHVELAAHRYLEPLREQLSCEVSSVRARVVRHANERQSILELVESTHSDLVILSAHGSGCDSGNSFGSVTTYLLMHAKVPLLVLQDLPEPERDQGPPNDARSSLPSLRTTCAQESA